MKRTDIQSLLREEAPNLEARIMELEEDLAGLESQVLSVLEQLPQENRTVMESYLCQLAELQLHMVVHSYKKGKEMGQNAKRTRKKS